MRLDPPQLEHTSSMKQSHRRWLKAGIGILISIACLAYMFTKVDRQGLLQALANFHWPLLGAGLAALGVDYALRIYRWRVILQAAGARTSFRRCAPAFLGSMALNNMFPLRAGDFVRAMVFPVSLGISRTTATASLVHERLVDLLALLACLGIGIAFAKDHTIPEAQQFWIAMFSAGSIVALVATILLAAPISRALNNFSIAETSRNKPRLSLFASKLAELMAGLAGTTRARILLAVGILSLLIWFGEAGLFLALLHGFGLPASPQAALVVMSLATLATLAPSSPGYIGPFHLAAYSAVIVFDGSDVQAAGFAILVHLTLWVTVTLAGVIGMVAMPSLFKQATHSEHSQ